MLPAGFSSFLIILGFSISQLIANGSCTDPTGSRDGAESQLGIDLPPQRSGVITSIEGDLSSNAFSEFKKPDTAPPVHPASPHELSKSEISPERLGLLDRISSFRLLSSSEDDSVLAYILFFCFIYLVGSLLHFVVPAVFSPLPVQPPVSVVWFLFGFLLELVGYNGGKGLLAEGIRLMGYVPANIIYMVLLPVLLYESAVGTNWHKFTKGLKTSLLLAYPGVAFTSAILGILFKVTFNIFDDSNGWWEAMLLGSAVSSTDPVAVISVLKSLNTPEKMLSMFEGESLLNDGTSVAFFQLFAVFATNQSASAGDIIWLIIRLLTLGPLFGAAWAFVTCLVVQNFHGHAVFQIVFMVTNVYLAFFVGEHYCGLSGPLTAVFFGLYVCARGKQHLEIEAQETHHHFVATLAALAESAIFIVAGLVSFRVMNSVKEFNPGDYGEFWWQGFVVYLYMNAARLSLYCIAFWYIRRTLYGFSWREMIVLVWGGLRGAIVLALALMIEDDRGTGYRTEFADFAMFTISAAVFFILLVNGTTFQIVFNCVNPYPCNAFRRVYLQKVMMQIDNQFKENVIDGGKISQVWFIKRSQVDILAYANRIVPELGWRQMDKHGRIPTKTPSVQKIVWDMLRNSRPTDGRENTKSKSALSPNIPTAAGSNVVSPNSNATSAVSASPPTTSPPSKSRGASIEHRESVLSASSDEDVDYSYRHWKSSALFSVDALHVSQSGARNQGTLMKKSTFNPGANLRLLHGGAVPSERRRLATAFEDVNDANSDASSTESVPRFQSDLAVPPRHSTFTTIKQMFSQQHHRETLQEVEMFAEQHGEEYMDIKKIKKERMSEVYIMVCNALRNSYRKYLEENFVNGKAMSMLEKSLDVVQDFSVTLLAEQAGMQVWKSVLKTYNSHQAALARRHYEKFQRRRSSAQMAASAFELEWQALQMAMTLNCYKQRVFDRLMEKGLIPHFLWRRQTILACSADVQAVVAFVHAHEKLLELGAESFHHMLEGELMTSYKQQLREGQAYLGEIQRRYPEGYNMAVLRLVACHLLHAKKNLVEEHSEGGLLMEEDRAICLRILNKQLQRVVSWNAFDVRSLCRSE